MPDQFPLTGLGPRPSLLPATPARKRSRWLAPGAAVGALAVAAVLSQHRLPEILSTLAGVRWWWVGAAVLAQMAAVGVLTAQQEFVLRSVGGRVGSFAMTATTLGGDTISVGIPFAGPPAAALFTYRRLQAAGNDAALIGWSLATSGVASTVALALVVAVGAGLTGSVFGAVGAALASLVAIVPVVVVLSAMHHRPAREFLLRGIDRGSCWLARRVPVLPAARLGSSLGRLVESFGALRLSPRRGLVVLTLALVNWLAAVACLAASVVAVGGTIPWKELLIIWSAGTGAGYLGLTPGGVGVVEAALTAAFVAAGSPASVALGAVLVYRAVTLWLVLLVGGAVLLAASRTSRTRRAS
jgi:putative heme transporter